LKQVLALKDKSMRIIVVGCGRIGSDLAYRLYRQGHEVVVIDNMASAFKNLPAGFAGRMVEGDVLNQDILHRAGIEKADALAAVTNSDTLNAVIAHIAQRVFGLTNVVLRNYEPISSALLKTFGVQFISSTTWSAQRLEELINHAEVRSVFSAGNGVVEIYELVVPDAWNDHILSELNIPGESMVVSVTRAGNAVLPEANAHMSNCDVVHVSATMTGIKILRDRLSAAVEA
jgi:trk system potassium uptake protein TrkA